MRRSEYSEPYSMAGVKPEPNNNHVYGVYGVYGDSKELPDAPVFPVAAMPRACQRLITEASAAIGCPPEFVALPMLVTLGSAIGNSRVIKLKQGWEEGAAIYGASIADPGEKKTPATKVALEPAIKTQAALREEYRRELEKYEDDKREHEVQARDARKEGRAAPAEPEAPRMERTLVEDTTVEALAVVLEGTPRGVLAMRDELSGWVRAMDQYKQGGRGADRQFWLSAWSNSYVSVDRKNRPEPLILTRPFVGVYGSIQPGVLPEIGDKREDGLLDRFLFAYPEAVPSEWSDAEITDEARDAYANLYRKVRALYMATDEYADPEPVRIHFSPAAKELMKQAINELRGEMYKPGFPTRLKGPYSKLEGYLARLCLLLACARAAATGAAERVEEDDVLKAVVLVDYFTKMARRVYVGLYGDDPLDKLAADLQKFLDEHCGSWRGQPAELHTQFKSPHKPARPEELSKAVRQIADRAPTLTFDDGHEAMERNGKRTTRRFIALSLRKAVNTVNTVNREGTARA